jgi:hypothetical protein
MVSQFTHAEMNSGQRLWQSVAARVMNISRATPAARLSAFLLPSEIVRIKPVQAIKIGRVVVARRMEDHAVAASPCRPDQFAAGFAAPLDTCIGSLMSRLERMSLSVSAR